MTTSPVQSQRAQQQVAPEQLSVTPKAANLVQVAAAEVLKPKADMVEKTMAKITAKVNFLAEESPETVSKFLGAVKGAVLAARDEEAADMAPIEQAYAELQDNCEPETVKTVIGYAKGMAAANILKKGASSDDQRAYIREQIAANDPLFTFLANPHGPVEELPTSPSPEPVVEQRAPSPEAEQEPVVLEQPAAAAPKAGLSTATKVVLATVALTGLALAAYKYAMPYFFPAAVEQQPETPVLPPVVEQVVQQTVSTIADTAAEVVQQTVSTVVDTGAQVAAQVGETFMGAFETVTGTSSNPNMPYYPQGTFFQAVNGTTPDPTYVGSNTCPAPVVQSLVDCAANAVGAVVDNTSIVFEQAPTFSTITPTNVPSFSGIAQPTPSLFDTIREGAGNATAWIADTAASLHASALEKAPVIGQAEAWVAQQAGNAVQFVQTQAPVVKDQVVEFAGAVGETVKERTLEALGYAHSKLPESVSAQGYTVNISSGLDQAADAVAAAQDEHVGAGVLGTATLATLWGVKKLKNAVCGRTAAPAPVLPIHPGAAFNIGAFPATRGNTQQIKNLLKANGVPAGIVDGNWNGVKAVLIQNALLPQGVKNRDTLARANAQQAVQVVQAAIAAGQIA